MSIGHQSPQSSLPPLSQKTLNTTTWGSGGNTATITDPYIHANSALLIWTIGSTPRAGTDWAQTVSQGQCVLTSTDAESSTLTFGYIVL